MLPCGYQPRYVCYVCEEQRTIVVRNLCKPLKVNLATICRCSSHYKLWLKRLSRRFDVCHVYISIGIKAIVANVVQFANLTDGSTV